MKRNSLFFVILSFVCFCCLNTVSAVSVPSLSEGQGIDYYRAGFPLVAKPLLISEIASNTTTLPETCFTLGNIYFCDNQVDSAAIYFNKGLAANPLNSLNAVGLAMLKIKASPAMADIDFKDIIKLKQNKKNIDIFIAIANAYLFNENTEKALFYHDKAKAIKSKYALLSVVMGDIELAKKNIGNACSNYEMAMYLDDQCKEAYIKYARAYKNVNSPLAIEKLGVLKTKQPNFLLADRELADIYFSNNNFAKAAELYAVYLKSGNSNVQDLTKYAFTLFLNGEFEKSLEVTNLGLAKSPRNPAFNRLAMYNNVDLKKAPEALKAAELFFNNTDKPEFAYLDYRYYGQALRNNKNFDLAIPQFEKALAVDSSKVDLLKDISDMYSEMLDYKNAIVSYTKYMSTLSDDKKTGEVYMTFGKLNYGLGTDVKSDDLLKKISLMKADSIFAQVAAQEPTGYRGNFWRARANSALDPETSLGLAKPYYELTATLVEAKADAKFNPVLIESYRYLGFYYYIQKDNVLSMSYWNKILALDPTNAIAKDAIEGIKKPVKAKK